MSFKGVKLNETLWRIDKLGMDLFKFSTPRRFLMIMKWNIKDRENWERMTRIDIRIINLAVGNEY
jgi:hypothetical protein